MKTLLISILIALLFTSCSLLDLNKDLKKQKELSVLRVYIDIKLQHDAQIVVALVDLEGSTVRDYRVLQEHKEVSFLVKQSKYKVYAFEDIDKNYKYSLNERTVGSEAIVVDTGENEYSIRLKIDSAVAPDEYEYIETLVKSFKIKLDNSTIHNGEIIPIDAEIFSDKNIKMGLWESYKFVYEVPFGIFMEHKYDPNKKIVLFVHGISGAPKNFKYLVDNLDKTKYQAFYAYYPSGLSLYDVSRYISRVLIEFKIKYQFDDIAIIAHSMGGLVSRNALNYLQSKNYDFVDTFITISSPLDGDKSANFGIKFAPDIMPSIVDIANGSEFLQQLYIRPLSEKVSYYLIFGVKGHKNDDGVVSIPSQLRMEAQNEASQVRGYNENHMSILSSKDLSLYITKLLDNNY